MSKLRDLLKIIVLNSAAVLCTVTGPTVQAAYPDRPIRVIVAFPAGGNVDLTTRAVLARMSHELGQPLVVVNMPGAAGSIGAGSVLRTRADGYTLLSTTVLPLVVNPVIIPDIKIRQNDFLTIGLLASVPCLLEVKADNKYGIRNFADFLAHARAHPDDLSVGHGGNGTMNQIVELEIQRDFGIQINPIPYKGSALVLSDLLGGQIDAMIDQLTTSQPQIQQGTLVALAITSAKRVPSLPNVPTFAELGKPDFEMASYSALMAPKGTPTNVLEKLNSALNKAIADPTVQKQLASVGASVAPGNLKEASDIVAREQKKLDPLLTSGMLTPGS
ncbi:Tripartite tricarboxylate transporter family receptor [Caballeronia sordidicola]|uniref:Tripartite tricarboxylate transporter family receptor n=1 Tax=Caballeronia sordidicola TaxID=196367 RepID=A0A158HZT3_CABSO|nr:tripartite tricarboxylate transporter substrate binding protein [Caballeronia sordidicola]SAL49874.1 Tripartite tricarboxylate transporter family receptor [Caballeronia sordidicola]